MLVRETNIDECKRKMKLIVGKLFFSEPGEKDFKHDDFNHPFTDSYYVKINNEIVDIRKDMRSKGLFIVDVDNRIEKANNLDELFNIIRPPFHYGFIKLLKSDITDEDYHYLIRRTWTKEKIHKGDINVGLRELISWFKNANKELLMTKEELDHYNSLPYEFMAYRAINSDKGLKGLSYTPSQDKVLKYFEELEGTEKKIIKIRISKPNVLAYFNDNGEDEIVVDILDKYVRKTMKVFRKLS